jgi:hypothetical protein
MPSTTAESVSTETQRVELQAVLQSQLFARSPALARLLSYLCEKSLAGEGAQIKEFSVAVDVFGRNESFDQDVDSIVRVEANRLRKRLAGYYAGEGAAHRIHITIPVGQYVPIFEEQDKSEAAPEVTPTVPSPTPLAPTESHMYAGWLLLAALAVIASAGVIMFLARPRTALRDTTVPSPPPLIISQPPIGLPVGEEVRILAGSGRPYVDRSGKTWSADDYFTGGTPVRSSVQHIWRTQDPTIYRTSRQGDFTYNIPLKPGNYELHLHFAETFYGPEEIGGGGESSRVMTVSANGKPLLTDFDVLADAEGGRTADVKVFTDVSPAGDGFLRLVFSSAKGGRGMVSAIEILPGTARRIRPVRIVARDVPYYSDDSSWWSSDIYFKGGQLAASEEPATGTDDPELYETERWGRFSYAIPVTPGRYTVILHFIERRNHASREAFTADSGGKGRVFNVFCNGKAIVQSLNILNEVGENRPLVRKISGLESNAQGKLLLDFVPVNNYATVTAIEVAPQ